MDDFRHKIFRSGTIARPLITLLISATLAGSTGCANWSYRNIHAGQNPRDYEKLLPAFDTRRTPLGLCYYKVDSLGGEDVIMILVSDNRRVAGKLRAQVGGASKTPGGARGLRLEGEISSQWLGSELPGPADALRYLLTRLADYHADNATMRAHGWAAAGLTRLLELYPQAEPITSLPAAFNEQLERVPGGGTGDMRADGDHIVFHYSQPKSN